MKKESLSLLLALAFVMACGCTSPTGRSKPSSAMEPRINVVTLGVADLERSYHFYKDGLGFPTKMTPDGGIVLFATSPGTRLMLYPYDKLGADAGFKTAAGEHRGADFPGFTFGHCVRTRAEVDAVMTQAAKAGAKIAKTPVETSWGGYSGYFQDPDGYSWEVLYSDKLKFNPDGSIVVE